MKPVYKQVKVINDAHLKEFQVYYKNFLFWHYECCYSYADKPNAFSIVEAQEEAIKRAEGMLRTTEVYNKSNFNWNPW